MQQISKPKRLVETPSWYMSLRICIRIHTHIELMHLRWENAAIAWQFLKVPWRAIICTPCVCAMPMISVWLVSPHSSRHGSHTGETSIFQSAILRAGQPSEVCIGRFGGLSFGVWMPHLQLHCLLCGLHGAFRAGQTLRGGISFGHRSGQPKGKMTFTAQGAHSSSAWFVPVGSRRHNAWAGSKL